MSSRSGVTAHCYYSLWSCTKDTSNFMLMHHISNALLRGLRAVRNITDESKSHFKTSATPLRSSSLFLMALSHQTQHHCIIEQKQRGRNNRACCRYNNRHLRGHRVLAYLYSQHSHVSFRSTCDEGHVPSCALYTFTSVLTSPATLFNKLGRNIRLITQM